MGEPLLRRRTIDIALTGKRKQKEKHSDQKKEGTDSVMAEKEQKGEAS